MARRPKYWEIWDYPKKDGISITEAMSAVYDPETGELKFPLWVLGGIIRGLIKETNLKYPEHVLRALVNWAIESSYILQENPDIVPQKQGTSQNALRAQFIAQGVSDVLKDVQSKLPHPTVVLRQQSNFILHMVKGFPFDPRNDQEKLAWVRTHLKTVLQEIGRLAKSFERNFTAEGFLCNPECPRKTKPPTDLSSFSDVKNPGELRDLILAHYHGIAPSHAKRQLYGRKTRAKAVHSR